MTPDTIRSLLGKYRAMGVSIHSDRSIPWQTGYREGAIAALEQLLADAPAVSEMPDLNALKAERDALIAEMARVRTDAEKAIEFLSEKLYAPIPCDVLLPPATRFNKGVKLSYVVEAMEKRKNGTFEFASYAQAHEANEALRSELNTLTKKVADAFEVCTCGCWPPLIDSKQAPAAPVAPGDEEIVEAMHYARIGANTTFNHMAGDHAALAAARPLIARQSTRRTDEEVEREIDLRSIEEARTKTYDPWVDALRWTLNKTERGR